MGGGGGGINQPQVKIIAAILWIDADSIRTRSVVRTVVTAAAAYDAVRTGSRTERSAQPAGHSAGPIPAPFPHVPAHIVYPIPVRLFLSYHMCLTAAVCIIPCIFFKPIFAIRSCPLVPLTLYTQCSSSIISAVSSLQNSMQSYQLTLSIGFFTESVNLLGLLPITACHNSCATSVCPMDVCC